MNSMPRLLLCLILLSRSSLATILDYPPLTASANNDLVHIPQSAFHDWSQAQLEAETISTAWQHEPASLAWTRLQLAKHIKHKTPPTRAARGLALTHVAMLDAYTLANDEHMDALQRRIALSMAAAEVLGYLYVAEESSFSRTVFALAAQQSQTTTDKLPATLLQAMALGKRVAMRVIAHAEADGAQRGWNGSRLQWYGEGRYYGPGSWEPTPPYFYYPPTEPFAPSWKAWVISNNAAYRPRPPSFGSAKYMQSLREVIDINRSIRASAAANVATATAQTVGSIVDKREQIAKFWVDGNGSVTPPGHWNQIAIDEVVVAHLNDKQTLRLFAQLNIAMADTFLAVWDAKYYYWTMRPITAAKRLLGVELAPIILTPPFPSYPSGHAAFSAAAAKVLGRFLAQQKAKFDDMAIQATMSRLYGGIHFRFDDDDGAVLGQKVAEAVLQHFSTN
jgi:hypothetical protein